MSVHDRGGQPESLAALGFASRWAGEGLAVSRFRDLVVIDQGATSIIVACDSNASTGDKPSDFLQQDPIITGYSAAKVPLMEVIAAGADPFLLVNNLCCDLETTGLRLLQGIRDLLSESGLPVVVTGSDESNMPTVQTGVGVTVLGIARSDQLRLGTVVEGDELWLAGTRYSGLPGDEYDEGVGGVASVSHILRARSTGGVGEILPVGSHGIGHECDELVQSSGLRADLPLRGTDALSRSAGASTCFVLAVRPGTDLTEIGLPMTLLGHVRSA
jgi:hypothetical protein